MTATRSFCFIQCLALAVAVSACAQQSRKPVVTETTMPVSLNAHENVVITPGAPSPSLPPLTPAEKAAVKWRAQGFAEVASTKNRIYLESQSGLRALNSADGSILWQNPNCRPVGATASIIGDEIFTACTSESLSILSADTGRVLRTAPVPMYGINTVVLAEKSWLAVQGWDDGATIVSRLVILRRDTLKPVMQGAITDGTFLGVIGDRVYIDDWCCNGRADEYRPATIYSISLRDGSQSEPVDLKPDPDRHPANLQPLGQGERNYMQGHYLYVPVDDVLYRYDIVELQRPPERLHLAGASPNGTAPQANAL